MKGREWTKKRQKITLEEGRAAKKVMPLTKK